MTTDQKPKRYVEETFYGTKVYYCLDAKYHREDGPAIEWAIGAKQWWYHGEHIDCKTQEEFERLMRLKAFW